MAACARLQQVRATVAADVVEAMTRPRLRQLSDEGLEHCDRLRDINVEIAQLEQARARLGLHAPSCAILDVSDAWMHEAHARVERAFAPQSQPKPTARLDPNYEPSAALA
jgi:hypothetical protein